MCVYIYVNLASHVCIILLLDCRRLCKRELFYRTISDTIGFPSKIKSQFVKLFTILNIRFANPCTQLPQSNYHKLWH